MSNTIGVINYGIAGNIRSIQKALDKAGASVLVVESPEQFMQVDKIVIPGVGSFPDAVRELKRQNLYEKLSSEIAKKPVLGICLGMQILSRIGFENERTDGLCAFDAEVRLIVCDGPVPHMGFNKLEVQKENELLRGLSDEAFYFMHSYEFVNYKDVLALTKYYNHEFVSAVSKENVFGVQFHPEKSRDAGIELFKNFINL